MTTTTNVQTIAWVGNVVTITYGLIGKSLTYDCDSLPKTVFVPCDASRHGIGQKLGDAKSGDKVGREKYEEVQLIWASLLEGKWKRSAAPPDVTPIIKEAVARVMKVTLEKIEETVAAIQATDTMTAEEHRLATIKEWGTNNEVKVAIAKIRYERTAAQAKTEEKSTLVIPGLK